jgi:hypothetical protein
MADGIPPTKSVWTKNAEDVAQSPPIQSFAEVMSEELAEELQEVCFEYIPN